MNIQVYTAIVGNHDPMRDDIHVFTEDLLGDPLLSARFYKTCPHIFFPDALFTIWIDGNVFLNMDQDELVSALLRGRPCTYSAFAHTHRSNVEQEIQAVTAAGMDTEERIARTRLLYRHRERQSILDEAIDKHLTPRERYTPLAMTMVLLRLNTPENAARNAAWWQSICYGSRRDQLTFPLHFPPPYLPTVDFTAPNQYFTRVA